MLSLARALPTETRVRSIPHRRIFRCQWIYPVSVNKTENFYSLCFFFLRDCVPQTPCDTPVPAERTLVHLNTLKDRHPGDLWARMHISSLEYAAGDITRKGRKKDKARVSELLQGLAFSGDSDVEEDNGPETQPAPKRPKGPGIPEKHWTKEILNPAFHAGQHWILDF